MRGSVVCVHAPVWAGVPCEHVPVCAGVALCMEPEVDICAVLRALRKEKHQLRASKTKLSAQRLICSEGQRAENKRQRQETGDKKRQETEKGRSKGIFALEGQRTTSGQRGDRHWPIGKWQFIKGKEETPC